jgi:hypothetical protein
MMLGIRVEQSSDHPLILSMMFPRFALKVLDTSLTQRDGHLHPLVSIDEFFRAREEIRNDLELSERFVCVSYFPAHTFAYLSANTRRRRSESRRCET